MTLNQQFDQSPLSATFFFHSHIQKGPCHTYQRTEGESQTLKKKRKGGGSKRCYKFTEIPLNHQKSPFLIIINITERVSALRKISSNNFFKGSSPTAYVFKNNIYSFGQDMAGQNLSKHIRKHIKTNPKDKVITT